MATPHQLRLRKNLARFAVIFAAGVIVFMLVKADWGKDAELIKATENLREAVKMKQQQSASAATLAVGILTVLWATLLAKSGEATFEFGDWPPTTLFLLSNALLIASMVFHSRYLEVTTNEMWTMLRGGKEMYSDVVHSWLNNAYFFQHALLLAALVAVVAHLLVVYKLKP